MDLKSYFKFNSWITDYSFILKLWRITYKQNIAQFGFFDLNLLSNSGKIVLEGPYNLRSMHKIIFKVISLKLGLFVCTFSSKYMWQENVT